MRTIYDRDVKQLSRIFKKQQKMNSPSGSPIDYSISIDDLKETSESLREIIKILEGKLKAYRTTCTHILFNLDTLTERVYKYFRNGTAGTGVGGVAARLSVGSESSTPCSSDSQSTESSGGYLNTIGWIGLSLFIVAILVTCVKDHVEKLKKEESEYQKLLEENNRMNAAHEASIAMLTSLQEKFDELMHVPLDSKAQAEDLTHKFAAHLNEHMTQKGMEIPDYLQAACDPRAIQRAILRRAPSGNHSEYPSVSESMMAHTPPPVNHPSETPHDEEKSVKVHIQSLHPSPSTNTRGLLQAIDLQSIAKAPSETGANAV